MKKTKYNAEFIACEVKCMGFPCARCWDSELVVETFLVLGSPCARFYPLPSYYWLCEECWLLYKCLEAKKEKI